jgi:hypothetical protein
MSGLQKHVAREEQIKLEWFDESGCVNPRFKSTAQGAATSIWATVAPELEGSGAHYLEDCSIAKPWSSDHPTPGVMPYAVEPESPPNAYGRFRSSKPNPNEKDRVHGRGLLLKLGR